MKMFLHLSISFFLLLNIPVFAQNESSTNHKNNLTVVKVKTANGTVTVNLPSNIHTGDVISGTVIAEPYKSTKKEKSKKEKKKEAAAMQNLQDSKLKICGVVTPISEKKFSFKVPENNISNTLALQLLDKDMNILNNKEIPVNKIIRTLQTPLQTPNYLRAGYHQEIKGAFDGNLTNSIINLNGEPLNILAESPESIIVDIPENISGIQELEINENGIDYTEDINVINLDLSIDKLSLSSGEKANMHLNVSGLENIETPVKIQIDNYTEGSVTLENGNHQELIIEPQLVNSQGIFSKDLQITAIHPGGYSLGVVLEEPSLFKLLDTDKKKTGDKNRKEHAKDTPSEKKKMCSYIAYSEWKKTGKYVIKPDDSQRKFIKTSRKKCHKCGKSFEWTYYKIPYYKYEIQKREKFKCSLRKHDKTVEHHGTSTTEKREIVKGGVIKYEIVRIHTYIDKKSKQSKTHSEHVKWRYVKK